MSEGDCEQSSASTVHGGEFCSGDSVSWFCMNKCSTGSMFICLWILCMKSVSIWPQCEVAYQSSQQQGTTTCREQSGKVTYLLYLIHCAPWTLCWRMEAVVGYLWSVWSVKRSYVVHFFQLCSSLCFEDCCCSSMLICDLRFVMKPWAGLDPLPGFIYCTDFPSLSYILPLHRFVLV